MQSSPILLVNIDILSSCFQELSKFNITTKIYGFSPVAADNQFHCAVVPGEGKSNP
jgi:hypothetical protein